MNGEEIVPGFRRGSVVVPPSKSHAHRVLIANFLAGDRSGLAPASFDSEDVLATKRCLAALAESDPAPELDCGESGSTLRFLAPVAAALGKKPTFVRRSRLAERPLLSYETLAAGIHELPGDVSSQFVTGLLFALPLLEGNSEIRFTSPLESRGYVEMTCRVLRRAGIVFAETPAGFRVPGSQAYRMQDPTVEGDWSGAAFWYGMNALGSEIEISGLAEDSSQPDRAIAELVKTDAGTIDVSGCPDLFPVLAVVAAGRSRTTTFVGIRRLRLKECDRVAAMAEALTGLGAGVDASEERFVVTGTERPFRAGAFRTFSDHRIAMALAVAATRAEGRLRLDHAVCAAKSYPSFFADFGRLSVDRPRRAYVIAMEKEAAAVRPVLRLGERLYVSGVGKSNAAAATQRAIDDGATEIVNVGLAGGFDPAMSVGDVVEIVSAVEYDFDLAAVNGTRIGQLEERDSPYIPCAASPSARHILATGDHFNDCEADLNLLAELGCTVRDMEGAAVAHVSERAGIPCRILKCISDIHGKGSMTGQYLENVAFCLEKLTACLQQVRRLNKKPI